jgi:ubiquinol-cytochrome c reductase iron-sulfur subunit
MSSTGDPGRGGASPTTTGIGVAFAASLLASAGLVIVYVRGGNVQLEGALLAVALGGIGVGLVKWGKQLMPVGEDVQERGSLPSTSAERAAAEESFEEGTRILARRTVLVRLLLAAAAGLVVVATFPVRSLGGRPGRALFETDWREGVRAVGADGRAIRADAVSPGTVLTVFPEGHVDSADSQALLIGLEPGVYRPLPGREDWAPNDLVGFSKVCTHAGCPVGLYRPQTHQLFCPCHQSVFDVLDGATPEEGPATRSLPQLPLDVDAGGYVVARGDFSAPVGPGFWDLPHG